MSEKNSPVRAPLLPYTAVADLIVQLMGKGCEVVLHDRSTPLSMLQERASRAANPARASGTW